MAENQTISGAAESSTRADEHAAPPPPTSQGATESSQTDVAAVVLRVRCETIELKLTLLQKLLSKSFVASVVTPFLKAFNKKSSSALPMRSGDVAAAIIEAEGSSSVRFTLDQLQIQNVDEVLGGRPAANVVLELSAAATLARGTVGSSSARDEAPARQGSKPGVEVVNGDEPQPSHLGSDEVQPGEEYTVRLERKLMRSMGMRLAQHKSASQPPLVADIDPRGPVAQTAVRCGDWLLAVNGVDACAPRDELQRALAKCEGEFATLTLRRGSAEVVENLPEDARLPR